MGWGGGGQVGAEMRERARGKGGWSETMEKEKEKDEEEGGREAGRGGGAGGGS